MTFTPPDTLMDNLASVNIPPTPPPPKSVWEELALIKQQRDDAWIEVAQLHDEIQGLRSMLAHHPMPPYPDSYPKHNMPERQD